MLCEVVKGICAIGSPTCVWACSKFQFPKRQTRGKTKTRSKMLVPRALGLSRYCIPSISSQCSQWIPPSICSTLQVRFGSMKVKRIQRKQPSEKTKARRLIKGTRLEVKRVRKPKSVRNTDPNKY